MPKKIDLTGQRFGRLLVTEKTEFRKAGSVVYKCVCDCGENSRRSYNDLMHDNVRSCGCLKKSPKRATEAWV